MSMICRLEWDTPRDKEKMRYVSKPQVQIRSVGKTKEGHHRTQKFVNGEPVGKEVVVVSTPSRYGYFNYNR